MNDLKPIAERLTFDEETGRYSLVLTPSELSALRQCISSAFWMECVRAGRLVDESAVLLYDGVLIYAFDQGEYAEFEAKRAARQIANIVSEYQRMNNAR